MIPSKKVFALILISIAIVTSAFILAERRNHVSTEPTYIAESQTSNLVAGTIDTYKDSDGDGLKDWEEALWGTDPEVSDAEKIKSKPSDVAKKIEHLTETDKLARSFFSQYMTLKEVGLQNDKESQERTIQNLVSTIDDASPQVYTQTVVKISTTATVRDYGNAVGRIIKTNTLAHRSELNTFRDALATENPRLIEDLKPIAQGYKTMLQQLIALQVPPSASTIHLRLINVISRVSFVIDSFTKAFSDPVKAIQGLALFESAFGETIGAFTSIVDLLAANNVVYTIDEPGYMFNKQQ